jgi:hypothetical protein
VLPVARHPIKELRVLEAAQLFNLSVTVENLASRDEIAERGSASNCVRHAIRLRHFASLSLRGTSGERVGERGN